MQEARTQTPVYGAFCEPAVSQPTLLLSSEPRLAYGQNKDCESLPCDNRSSLSIGVKPDYNLYLLGPIFATDRLFSFSQWAANPLERAFHRREDLATSIAHSRANDSESDTHFRKPKQDSHSAYVLRSMCTSN
ncbi:unnamed protein product [Diplocarpon coronariae]